ncbi:MAG TPA: SDR family oxidoreductase, partial [Pyrinomonadaceae bacterium]|nr:SDR family oxidoreductase [Pyrinomonadaceae bacterium]
PGQTLTTLARQQLDAGNRQRALSTLPSAHGQKSDLESLLSTLGRLWIYGVQPDWTGFYKNEIRHRIPLPTYPFERERYWVEPVAATVKAEKRLLEGKLPDIADWFYASLWKQTRRPVVSVSEAESARQARWLVLTNGCGLGSQVVEEMKKRNCDCVVAIEGDAFEQLAAGTYSFNPTSADDYEALFRELRVIDRVPTRVVHLLSVTQRQPNVTSAESFRGIQQRGVYSLITLAKTLREHSILDSLRIDVISSDAQDVTAGRFLCAEKATIQAFCKIVPQEFTGFSCRSIDVAGDEATDVALAERLAMQLVDELVKDAADKVVACRDNRRWVQIYEPAPLPEATAETSLFKTGGVYLITGGLGRIGLYLAVELARSWHAKLVLVGRSDFLTRDEWQNWLDTHDAADDLSELIRKRQELDELGAEILLVRADVSNPEQMRAAVDQAEQRFGRIDGVIHAAGDDRMNTRKSFEEVTEADFERMFKAKVHGLMVLADVLQERPLDFCLVMSSLSVVLGGLGFMTSAAAHFFVDAFVARLNHEGSTFPWITVDWDGWQEGAAADVSRGVAPEEGLEVFRRVLTRNAFSPIVVSTENLHTRIAKWIDLESLRSVERTEQKQSFSGHARPNLSNAYVAPRNEIEATVATIWETLLGFEQVGVYDNLFDLGGDSLLIVQIISRVRETLRVEVPLRSVFEEPTIAALAEKVEQLRHESSAEVRTIAETLELVERLSGEELGTLLSQHES